MIVKVLLTLDYDPNTNSYKELKSEIIKETIKVDPNEKPQIILYDNKYQLNNAAMSLLNVSAGDRIDIRYQIINKVETPIIGSIDAWGDKNGNKITKSQTVSFRGSANEQLANYGNTFTLKEYKNGLFILDSGNMPVIEEDDNIQIPEDTELSEDLTESVPETVEEEIELDEEIEDDSKYELSDTDFDF